MRHWIRDAVVDQPAAEGSYGGAFFAAMWTVYHFLRTCGWKWIWEDDSYYYNLNGSPGGVSNSAHCPDSSMEAVGTANWTPDAGIVVAKDSTQRHMLTQSLKITNSLNGSSGSVDSDNFINMLDTYSFACVLQYRNPTSNTYTATINGVSVDLIPTAGAWERSPVITFISAGTTDKLEIGCPDVNGAVEDIWIDSIIVYRGWYERFVQDEDLSASPDGQLLNGDEFHSDSHSFVSGDIGRLLCVYDPTNEGNSGVWKITGLNGNDAVLDLRDGGSWTMTPATGLRWRLIDSELNAPYYNGGGSILAGFGLESPHSTKWRFFAKPNWVGGPSNLIMLWMSPTDADFDVETGYLSESFPVTYDVHEGKYSTNNFAGFRIAGDSGYRGGSQQRLFVVTDDEGTYLQLCFRPPGSDTILAYGIFGVSGADANVDEDESFISLCVVGSRDGYSDLQFGTSTDSFGYQGAMATKREFMVDARLMMFGMGHNNEFSEKSYGSNGQANPFSGKEWTIVPVIMRDLDNSESQFAQKELTTFGCRHCRVNFPVWSLVDTDLLHINNGWCMPWPDGATPL